LFPEYGRITTYWLMPVAQQVRDASAIGAARIEAEKPGSEGGHFALFQPQSGPDAGCIAPGAIDAQTPKTVKIDMNEAKTSFNRSAKLDGAQARRRPASTL
jgi:hypothetical protein